MVEMTLSSPLGPLRLVADDAALVAVVFSEHRGAPRIATEPAPAQHPVLRRAARELEEYFAGTRTRFDVPLAPRGTCFQLAVWTALRDIDYGERCSYGELAERIGRSGSARAVGHANGKNPLSVLVPCHRVVGSDGRLTGYAGGLERKRWLLEHERAVLERVAS